MTIKQAIKIIERHNKWRRDGKGRMQDPRKIGKAIDVLLLVAESCIKLYDMDKVKVTTKKV